MADAEDVLTFWLSPAATTEVELENRKGWWFATNPDLDRQIGERFGSLVARARAGELDVWADTPRGALALIILIDQFSRNLHRGKPDAFACDGHALALARRGFDVGQFDGMGTIERMFAALPFRHAETVEDQKRACSLAVTDAMTCEPFMREFCVYSVDWARKHLDVIVRFGRFPHRNAAVGRASTPEEIEYLAYLKLAGQWL